MQVVLVRVTSSGTSTKRMSRNTKEKHGRRVEWLNGDTHTTFPVKWGERWVGGRENRILLPQNDGRILSRGGDEQQGIYIVRAYSPLSYSQK
jgi:hypothetical protein